MKNNNDYAMLLELHAGKNQVAFNQSKWHWRYSMRDLDTSLTTNPCHIVIATYATHIPIPVPGSEANGSVISLIVVRVSEASSHSMGPQI